MYAFNIDSKTSRVLMVGKLGDGIKMLNSICIDTIPDDIDKFNDYLYINGEFVYSPIEKQEDELTYQ